MTVESSLAESLGHGPVPFFLFYRLSAFQSARFGIITLFFTFYSSSYYYSYYFFFFLKKKKEKKKKEKENSYKNHIYFKRIRLIDWIRSLFS
jgi:hypothetical protein